MRKAPLRGKHPAPENEETQEANTAERSFAEVARSLAAGTSMSRRQALRWIGGAFVGAALARFPGVAFAAPAPGKTSPGAPTQHGAMLRGLLLPTKNRLLEGRFGLMFKRLEAFEPSDELLTKLAAIMKEGVARDVADTSLVPAGFVFLGQFIDHDLTFDATPVPQQPVSRRHQHATRSLGA